MRPPALGAATRPPHRGLSSRAHGAAEEDTAQQQFRAAAQLDFARILPDGEVPPPAAPPRAPARALIARTLAGQLGSTDKGDGEVGGSKSWSDIMGGCPPPGLCARAPR